MAGSLTLFNTRVQQIGIIKQAQLAQDRIEILEADEQRDDHLNEEKESTSTIESEFNFFERFVENAYNENLNAKISNLKMNSVSVRRKDELFKRHKKEQ